MSTKEELLRQLYENDFNSKIVCTMCNATVTNKDITELVTQWNTHTK